MTVLPALVLDVRPVGMDYYRRSEFSVHLCRVKARTVANAAPCAGSPGARRAKGFWTRSKGRSLGIDIDTARPSVEGGRRV